MYFNHFYLISLEGLTVLTYTKIDVDTGELFLSECLQTRLVRILFSIKS